MDIALHLIIILGFFVIASYWPFRSCFWPERSGWSYHRDHSPSVGCTTIPTDTFFSPIGSATSRNAYGFFSSSIKIIDVFDTELFSFISKWFQIINVRWFCCRKVLWYWYGERFCTVTCVTIFFQPRRLITSLYWGRRTSGMRSKGNTLKDNSISLRPTHTTTGLGELRCNIKGTITVSRKKKKNSPIALHYWLKPQALILLHLV